MRSLLMALMVVGLLAAPSLGVINIKLTADNTSLNVGDVTTVHLMAQGTVAGVASAGGYVAATGTAGTLTSNAGSLAWVPFFLSPAPFGAKVGTAGANGGWGTVGTTATGFGSQQANYLAPDPTFGQAAYAELASYKVTAAAPGTVTLTVSPASISGFKFVETDKTAVFGQNIPVSITVVPEPMTLALLAFGGLVVARRRSR